GGEGDGGGDDVGEGQHEGRLVPQAGVVGAGVPPEGEQRVRPEQPDAVLPVTPVPGGEAVHADQAVEPGQAAHEQNLDQGQVGADQAGDPAGGGEPVGGAVQQAGRRVDPPDADGGDRAEEIGRAS